MQENTPKDSQAQILLTTPSQDKRKRINEPR